MVDQNTPMAVYSVPPTVHVAGSTILMTKKETISIRMAAPKVPILSADWGLPPSEVRTKNVPAIETTMPIAARMVAVTIFATVITVIHMTTQDLGTTIEDSAHRLTMAGQYPLGEFSLVSSAMLPKDFGQLGHGKSAMSWSMASPAKSSERRVK